MKKYFMKLKLAHRLFLIIIIFFLIPFVLLYFASYGQAESIIKEKIRNIKDKNIHQVGNNIENMCINLVNASNYLVSLDIYGQVAIPSDAYNLLTAYHTADTLIRNINNSMLNSQAEINIFSKDSLLYSTDSNQNINYQGFYESYIKKNEERNHTAAFLSSVHPSYIKYKTQEYISYIQRIPTIPQQSFYLVISLPVSAFKTSLNSTTGTMILLDSYGNTICRFPDSKEDYSKITEFAAKASGSASEDLIYLSMKESKDMLTVYPMSVYRWKLLNVYSPSWLYAEIYELRRLVIVLSFIPIALCLSLTFYCIYKQLKPLLHLKESMEVVSRGNLEPTIELTDSQDEIGVLAQTFQRMLRQINLLIGTIRQKEEEKNNLKFEVLLAQINPHFLFNTLNSIKWMSVVAGTSNITSTITSLGRLLEISMNKTNDILPIEEEITNIKSYVQIQSICYPGRFKVKYDIDGDILTYLTPKLILQPLVENSILHNIEHREFLEIYISGEKRENLLIFTVWDNGIGIPIEQLHSVIFSNKSSKKGQVFRGIGVYNIHERIRLIYGEKYGLRYESDGNSYTKAMITFPVSIKERMEIQHDKDTYCR